MNEDMSEFKDLIRIMETTPKVQPPDGFTEGVMVRLATEQTDGVWMRIHSMIDPIVAGVGNGWIQQMTVSTPRECSLCFFMTGFFYLIMGIILTIGFRTIGSGMALADWIALQPYLAIGSAIWLMTLGVILIMDGRVANKLVQYGTLLYIFFTVFNGVLMRPYLHIPYAGVFITGFIAASAVMGTMLALAVRKMELGTVR